MQRWLYAVSQFHAYPMPWIDDLCERTVLLLHWTFAKVIGSSPLGLLQFWVMPFELHGARATFQRFMDQVLQDCVDSSASHLDNVVIFNDTWQAHLQHLHCILGKIQKAGLSMKNVSGPRNKPVTLVTSQEEGKLCHKWINLKPSETALGPGQQPR